MRVGSTEMVYMSLGSSIITGSFCGVVFPRFVLVGF